jgi:methyl-accepting chemotaxis protein
MRPWMIAAAGAAVGIIAAAASWLAQGAPPAGGWTMLARAEGPLAALVFLAAYAAVALLLTTGVAIFDLARVRLRLDEGGASSRRAWFAAFADTSVAPLADRLIDLAAEDGPVASAGLMLQSRFVPEEARREAVRHYRDRLVRAQFDTALGLLVVIAGLGLAQEFAHVRLLGFVVPAQAALAAIAILGFLAICARVAAATMTEPLIDAIARLPRSRLELRLVETLPALVERAAELRRGAALPAANPVLDRLAIALEEGRESLNDAIARLSASAATLAQTARSIAERGSESGDGAAIGQLREAIAELAATIERLSVAAPPAAGDEASPSVAGATAKRRRAPRRGDLGSELRRLISEFD